MSTTLAAAIRPASEADLLTVRQAAERLRASSETVGAWEAWLRSSGLVRAVVIEIKGQRLEIERVPWRAVLDRFDPRSETHTRSDTSAGATLATSPGLPSRQPGASRGEAAPQAPTRRR